MRRGILISLAAAALAAGAPAGATAFGPVVNWGTAGPGPGQFGEAADVSVGDDFEVYVADRFNDRVQVFSPLGVFRRAWSTPESFGLDVAGGEVVLSEFNDDGVRRYSTLGVFRTRWGALGLPTDPQPRYREPWGIDVGPDGLVYVADSVNSRIVVTTGDGVFVRQMGVGIVSSPFGVAADPSGGGSVWVADTGNSRIVRLDPGGSFNAMGGPGAGDGQFSTPWDIAFDPGGDLVVSDRGNDRIQRINRNGAFISKFGTLGGGPAQLSAPEGVAVDAAGNVYVADVGNQRIVRWGDRANLSATITASRPAATAGETVTFTVRVANGGPDPARLAGAALALPPNAAPAGASATQGGCDGAACALGTIPAGGAAAATFTVRATAAGALPVTGTATSPTFDADVTDNAAAASVAVAAPPVAQAARPALALSAPRVSATWRRSRVRGRVRATVETPRAARVDLAVLAGPGAGARLAGRILRLPRAGRFIVSVPLRPRTAPGTHTLRVREVGVPAADQLTAASARVRLPAPPEGVVARAFVSRGVGGRGLARIRGRAPSFLFANFRFSGAPKVARRLRVAWSWSGRAGVVAASRVRPVQGLAVSPLRSGSGPLPAGRYRAVLSYGAKVVAVATVRLG